MTIHPRPPREIDGKGRTVRELLAGRKYSIDYYQREYKWQQKQVAELIDDLAAKFLESHEDGNERSAVADYGHYFLGSIIISDKDGQKFIIDGQQRLTTLTLLLIFLHHKLGDAEQKGQIADLIFSQKFGKRSFNLDIPERTACMEALYKGEEFADADAPESIANILARYADLEDLFPEELAGAGAAVLRGLAGRERAPGRDHRLLRRRRLHDLRDDERPRALAHPRGHAQGLPARRTSPTPTSAPARAASGRSGCRRWPSSARTRTPTASSRGCAASTPRASASASAAQRRRTST